MIKSVISVYDTVAKVYGPPLAFLNAGEGARWFSDMVQDPQNGGNLHRHPKDFVLYQIGEFDDVSGELKWFSPANRLGLGTDFVPVVKKEVV